MLGRILGALAGRSAARQIGGRRAGPLGAVVGVALPMVLRRFGPLGMIGVAVGSYAFKKLGDRYTANAAAAEGQAKPE